MPSPIAKPLFWFDTNQGKATPLSPKWRARAIANHHSDRLRHTRTNYLGIVIGPCLPSVTITTLRGGWHTNLTSLTAYVFFSRYFPAQKKQYICTHPSYHCAKFWDGSSQFCSSPQHSLLTFLALGNGSLPLCQVVVESWSPGARMKLLFSPPSF